MTQLVTLDRLGCDVAASIGRSMDRFGVLLRVDLQLLVHLLVKLVSHAHIILEVSLGLRLRLLESHRHELFVGLRLRASISLVLLHGLKLTF